MIDPHQGYDDHGRPFGYDLKRNNFITWGQRKNGSIYVISVDHDETESDHGSLSESRKDAIKYAKTASKTKLGFKSYR